MNTTVRKLVTFKLSILAIFISTNILAKPNADYQIELIIFKNLNNAAIYKEGWNNTALKVPADVQLINNEDGDPSNHYYKFLPNSQLGFSSITSKLKRSSSYSPIAHISWIQPKKDFNNSKTIYFTAGDQFKANSGSETAPEISGTLKFSLKRFVHATVSTQINLPMTQNTNGGTTIASANNIQNNQYTLQPFALNEQRRLKNDEVNYFDHPAFGLILIVKEV